MCIASKYIYGYIVIFVLQSYVYICYMCITIIYDMCICNYMCVEICVFNMCINIVCERDCDVISFEINLIFLVKSFFYMTTKSRQKPKYLENQIVSDLRAHH